MRIVLYVQNPSEYDSVKTSLASGHPNPGLQLEKPLLSHPWKFQIPKIPQLLMFLYIIMLNGHSLPSTKLEASYVAPTRNYALLIMQSQPQR